MEVSKSIEIEAPVEKVWKALVTPTLIKKWLFGTDASSEWKKDSDIRFRGEWQGKTYEDKGKIISIIPLKLLHHTYWSSMSGTEDKPENYVDVKYIVESKGNKTHLTITQNGIKTEESKKHLEENWGMVIENIKKTVHEMS